MCNKTILSVLKQFFNKLSYELIVNGQRYLKGDGNIPLVLQDFVVEKFAIAMHMIFLTLLFKLY